MRVEKTDHGLIDDYLRHGDEEALRLLFERHMKQIYGFLVRFTGSVQDAEDLTQETLVKAWKHIKSVDPERSFRTWLFSIARHSAVDHLRKRRSVPFAAFEDDAGGNALIDQLEDDADLPDEIVARQDAVDALRAALAALSPSYREVLIMHTEGGLSFQEIGEALGEPLNTVKSRYRRAFFALRALLQRP